MAHADIHHTATIIHVLLYTSSILLGRLAGLSSRCLLQDLDIFLRFFTECPRISLYPFCFEVFASFHFLLHFISNHLFRIKEKKNLLPFRFILLRSENDSSFASFLFRFCFVSFSFRFRFLRFASMRNKWKYTFFASKRKEFRFRFASFRFEVKMTAHPNVHTRWGYLQTGRCEYLTLHYIERSRKKNIS